MSDYPSFSVRNLGPIAEGTVELRPLTILIGKNNTGKTYMAQSIYSAFKALERADSSNPQFALYGDDYRHGETVTRQEVEVLRNYFADGTPGRNVLQGSLRDKVARWLQPRLEDIESSLANCFLVYFNVAEMDELTRWNSDSELSMLVRHSLFNGIRLFGINADTRSELHLPSITSRDLLKSVRGNTLLRTVERYLLDDYSTGAPVIDWRNIDLQRISSILDDIVWLDILFPRLGLNGTAHYLPAGRSGLLEAWTDVVRLQLQQDRDSWALQGREAPSLGGTAFDFLITLLKIIQPSPRHTFERSLQIRSPSVESALRILEALISGTMEVARDREQPPSMFYVQDSRSIPVQRASSMVAEVAPLLTWIENILVPGDLLLIDEPEAHMHPEAVLAVAKTLVELARNGIRVVCTTHSSEFLHQVSNCMLRAKVADTFDNSDQVAICIEELGVYRFEHSDSVGGTRIIPVEIDPNWGIPEDEHVAIAERLSTETYDLFYKNKQS